MPALAGTRWEGAIARAATPSWRRARAAGSKQGTGWPAPCAGVALREAPARATRAPQGPLDPPGRPSASAPAPPVGGRPAGSDRQSERGDAAGHEIGEGRPGVGLEVEELDSHAWGVGLSLLGAALPDDAGEACPKPADG